jgi:hypothetical protein
LIASSPSVHLLLRMRGVLNHTVTMLSPVLGVVVVAGRRTPRPLIVLVGFLLIVGFGIVEGHWDAVAWAGGVLVFMVLGGLVIDRIRSAV